MAIILESIKQKNKDSLKTKYRYLDYNDLAIGQIGVLLINFLNNKIKDGLLTIDDKSKILSKLHLNEEFIDLKHIEDKSLFVKLLTNIESESIKTYTTKENSLISEIITPKLRLGYLYEVSDELKKFYSKGNNKNIYPEILSKEIFSILDYSNVSLEDLFNGDAFDNNKTLLSDDLTKDFMEVLEKELIYTTIDSHSPIYNISSIKLDSQKATLDIEDLKNLAPILINGHSIVWDFKEDISLTKNKFRKIKDNIDLDKSILSLKDVSLLDKNQAKYTFQSLNDQVDFYGITDSYTKIKMHLLKSMIEIDALSPYIKNTRKIDNYKNDLIIELNNINKIYNNHISNLKLELENIEKTIENNKNNNLDYSLEEFKKNEIISEIDNSKLDFSKYFTKINNTMSKFRKEKSNIEILLNKDNLNKSFSFDNNYYQIKTIFDSLINQNEGLSMLLQGPPDMGKSHSLEELIKLFGGTTIKQQNISLIGSVISTFQQGSTSLDSKKRTSALPEIQVSVINGESGGGIVHMEEGARTFLEFVSKKNSGSSISESTLLSLLEPLKRKDKCWKIDNVYGRSIELYPAEHLKYIWSTNLIPDNVPNEIAIRLTSIPIDFSTLTNYKTLNGIVENMFYKKNIEEKISNFSSELNFDKFKNIFATIIDMTKSYFKNNDLDNLYNHLWLSNDKNLENIKIQYSQYKKFIDKDNNKINELFNEKELIALNDLEKYLEKYEKDNNVFLLFNFKDKISSIANDFNDIKKYLDDNSNLFQMIRLKFAIDGINKDFDLNINFFDYLQNNQNLNIDLLNTIKNEYDIPISDLFQRYHSFDLYLMSMINNIELFNDFKYDLLKSNSIINELNSIEIFSKPFMKELHNTKVSEEESIYKTIKNKWIEVVIEYNEEIVKKYNEINNENKNKYNLLPFKSADAPIIGFEKILNTLSSLYMSKGVFSEELKNKTITGLNQELFNEILNNSFFKEEINSNNIKGF